MLISAASLLVASLVNAGEIYYVKTLEFPADADSLTKIEMASRLVPTSAQKAWQDLELTAFLHFGINTFTDREWGDGKENPELFAPDSLDVDQWISTLKKAGFKLAILTAKHHDGFCLWPTATTKHSVAATNRPDVMQLFSDACRKYGIKMGVYLSPWDRNAPCYGDSPKYNDMFDAQLRELLTQYGKVDEVWFDGANGEGPNGKRQEYDWQRFRATINELQPGALLAIMGDDVRWVGNEKGQGRFTEWSTTALAPGILPDADEQNTSLNLMAQTADLGSRSLVAKADRLYWYPSEVDVSIRPGWFWHASEQPRSLRSLAEIYLNSVGKNSVLLLNVPPDRSGRIHKSDSIRLMELRQWIDDSFSKEVILPGDSVNCVVVSEDITHGQRVEQFVVNAFVGDSKIPVARGTTVGHKRILMFNSIQPDSINVEVVSSRGEPHLLPIKSYFVVMPKDEESQESKPDDFETTLLPDGSIVLGFGYSREINGFSYKPVEDEGLIIRYNLYFSNNGSDWERVSHNAEFANIVNNPIEQNVIMAVPRKASFMKIEPTETDGKYSSSKAIIRPI